MPLLVAIVIIVAVCYLLPYLLTALLIVWVVEHWVLVLVGLGVLGLAVYAARHENDPPGPPLPWERRRPIDPYK